MYRGWGWVGVDQRQGHYTANVAGQLDQRLSGSPMQYAPNVTEQTDQRGQGPSSIDQRAPVHDAARVAGPSQSDQRTTGPPMDL